MARRRTTALEERTIRVLKDARDFIDPDKSPPRHMTNREMVYEIEKLLYRLEHDQWQI